MDIQHSHKLAVIHVRERLVTEDTSVVNNHVDAFVGVDYCLHNSIAVLSAGLDASRLSAKLLDFLHNRLGVCEIVDHNLRASLRELQAVNTPKPSTTSSDQHDLTTVIDLVGWRVRRQLLCLLE